MTDDASWPAAVLLETSRLQLEPLRVEHADVLAPVLDDASLHTFTGGEPATVEELRARFTLQTVGHSPDGNEGWLNWVIRLRASGEPAGTVQATLHRDGDRMTADVAWVVGSSYQGQGVASESALAMVGWLRDIGVEAVSAYVHPDHAASAGVARRLGLTPTTDIVEGEIRWTSS